MDFCFLYWTKLGNEWSCKYKQTLDPIIQANILLLKLKKLNTTCD